MTDLAYESPAQMPDLRGIAAWQRGIILCILVYVCCFALPLHVRIFLGLVYLTNAITAMVFVFLLALKVYSTGRGILLAILTLIPLIGLIVLLVINAKATAILKAHHIPVGLLGATVPPG